MKTWTTVLLPLLPASCVTDQAYRYYGTEKFPPRPVESVEVLKDAPTRAYTVIAEYQSRGEWIQSLRERAAEVGADAIVVRILGGFGTGPWASGPELHRSFDHIIGVAIKYK